MNLRLEIGFDRVSSSWWIEDALARANEAPRPLRGDLTVDVAIVGGGYTGLWTAIALRERDPSLEVVLVEAGRCGSQASGKNGGVVHGYWTGIARVVSGFGVDRAREILDAGSAAQEALRGFCEPRADEVWWTERGVVKVSTTPQQDRALDAAVAAAREAGRPEQAFALSEADLRERATSPRFRRGVFFPEAATVHPARLAQALRAEAARLGTAVYEESPVVEVRNDDGRYLLVTSGGTVRAQTVVLATNAALAGLPAARPHLTTFSSYAVMTDPAPEALAEHGWTGGEALLDARMFLHYFRTTPDGRVLMGTGSGPIGYGARFGSQLTRDASSLARAVSGLHYLLPAFRSIGIAGSWGGPIDVSSDHLPFFGVVDGTRIFYGVGYSGHGVNAGWIGGQTLASLVLGRSDRWARSPFTERRQPGLPPEPLRYVGGRLIRAAILSCEEAEQEGRRGSAPARAVASLPRMLGMRIGTR